MGGSCSRRVFIRGGGPGWREPNNQQDDRSRRLKQVYDSLSLSQDVPARLRATAEKIVPFVPRRVESAFLSGVFNHESSGGGVIPLISPRRFQGVVLLVCASYQQHPYFLDECAMIRHPYYNAKAMTMSCFSHLIFDHHLHASNTPTPSPYGTTSVICSLC